MKKIFSRDDFFLIILKTHFRIVSYDETARKFRF